MQRGSNVQTSPRLPEKMHRELQPRTPRVLLKDNSKTDPPESHMSAKLYLNVKKEDMRRQPAVTSYIRKH